MSENKSHTSHWPLSILNGLSAIISIALPMLMSRHISSSEIGEYKIYFLYLSMVPALSLTGGIENGVYYWCGLSNGAKERIRSAWSMNIVHVSIFFITILIFSPLIKNKLNWDWLQFFTFAVASLTVSLGMLYEAMLIARKKIWKGAILSSIGNAGSSFAILFAVWFYKSALLTVWAFTIVMALKILVSYYMERKDQWIPFGLDFSMSKEVRKYYMPISMAGVFDFLSNNSDRFLLSILIAPAQFAIYSFGCLVIPPLQILESSVNKVSISHLSSAIEKDDKLHAAHIYRSSFEQIMLIFVPSFIGLFIFSDAIIKFLFTDKFIESAHFLRLYSLWILLSGIPYDVAARAAGNSKWILKNTIRIGSFSLILCGILTYFYGPTGSLISMICTLILQKYYGFKLMVKDYGWSIKEMIPIGTIILYFGLAGGLGVISYFLRDMFTSSTMWFFVCGSLFGIIYLSTLYLMKPGIFKGLKKSEPK